MKKAASRIKQEIARLQEQLRLAETREAERIGRIALKAGLGEIEIEEAELQAAFEQVARGFRGGQTSAMGKRNGGYGEVAGEKGSRVSSGSATGSPGEA